MAEWLAGTGHRYRECWCRCAKQRTPEPQPSRNLGWAPRAGTVPLTGSSTGVYQIVLGGGIAVIHSRWFIVRERYPIGDTDAATSEATYGTVQDLASDNKRSSLWNSALEARRTAGRVIRRNRRAADGQFSRGGGHA